MRKFYKLIQAQSWIMLIFLSWLLFPNNSSAQQLRIGDFVLFGGNGTCPTGAGQTPGNSPGCAVQIGSSSYINGGSVGSYKLVKSTGSATIVGNIYSGGTIQLTNSNAVTGKITAANSQGLTSTILSVGSNASLGGNIDVNGNIIVSGGTVSGRVTHPVGTTYSGPLPGGGNITGTPSLPILPLMPDITSFPAFGSTDITNTSTITPGAYRNVTLGGNKTLTLSGPGVYVFKSIKNTGNTNNFVFNFQNTSAGNFFIYIHGDVDLNKVNATTINGGSATRIFAETHGTGSGSIDPTVAWNIANGSSGSNTSKWLGSIWAPYAAINVGSGSGSSEITGALWSATQVNIQSGVTINYAPFQFCTPPNVNAGLDKTLDFSNPTTLTGTSTTAGVTFNWQAINGGVITSPANAAAITVSSAGTYVLTVTSTSGCAATDEVVVTGRVNNIIGSELQAVVQNGGAPSPFFEIQNGKIFIDVIVKQGEYNNVKGILTNPPWGMTNLLGVDASNFIITGLFPINKLLDLNNDPVLVPKIVYARPYYRAFNNHTTDPPATGIVTSQGDTSIRTHLVRKGYSLSGEGVKIGVLSNSFNTITAATTNPVSSTVAQDVANGDLPGPGNPNGYLTPVTVLKDATSPRSDEGRAMLQIIHDIAPKAQLYFRTGVETANDFAAGIRELKAAGCDIITEDLTYITEPFLKDGVVASAVAEVTTGGATYVTSAGNFANKSFEFPYNPITAPGGISGTAHNFSSTGSDPFLSVGLTAGNYTMVLQWIDDIYSQGETATGGTKNDLDIYLTPNTNGTALFGFNRNNLNGDPIEFLPFTLTAATQTNFLIINNTTTSNPSRFKVVIFQGNITFNEYVIGGGSTIVGQSNAPAAITVGAVRYDKAGSYPGPLAIESFSSVGGTVVGGTPRNKPDLAGPDGVNTTVNMGIDQVIDADVEYSNFLGTSAAAPHVAGVAALIIEGKRKFLNQASVSAAEMKSLLQSTAIDMGTPGFDFSSGSGFVNADAAMRTFAAPDPTLIQLHVPTGITPGETSFTLTVTGLNLSPTSVIKFRDSTLTLTYLSSERDTAKAVVPQFIGDPAISVYTPPVFTNGIDGGTSDTLRFFGVPKKNIVVRADNKSKKYAQSFPALTVTITVNGVPLSELPAPGLTLQQLGLDIMTITSSANNVNSDVGTYIITPSRTFNPNNSTDIGLKELYNYSFINGTMTIEKLPVTVTAQDLTITYGEKLPDIGFSYTITNASDAASIPDQAAVLSSLQSTHQNQIAKDAQGKDILGLVNKQAVYFVNGQALVIENGQALVFENNLYRPVVNAQALTIENGVVTDTVGDNLASSQITNLSFLATAQSLLNTREIINQKLVGGSFITETTKVIDITQESILDYNVNAAQTSMLNSLSNATSKGLVDIKSYTNGQALVIENGQALVIENGLALTIENGQALYIENGLPFVFANGQALVIENGQALVIENGEALVVKTDGTKVPLVYSQNKTAVIINSSDIGARNIFNNVPLKSLNLISGLDAGQQFIIPGTLLNPNFDITHIAGIATIQPIPVLITPTPGQTKVYGTADPVFTYTSNAGPVAIEFTGAISRANPNVNNVGTYAYSLGTLKAGPNYTLTIGGTNTFAITKASLTVTADNKIKTYGSADPALTYTASGNLFYGDGYNVISGVSLSTATGASATFGTHTITASGGTSLNYTIIRVNGTLTVNKKPLTVTADNKSRLYGENNPPFTVTYSGFAYGQVLSTSGVTGAPALSTSATTTSPAGNYPITVTGGTLSAQNYSFNPANGTLTINNNPCLLTHSPFKNFGSTTVAPTSLWMNMTTKVSGQLQNGDYLLFKAGTITLNYVSSTPVINNLPVPDGKIVAENGVLTPVTYFDAVNNTWVTKVPPGYSSTSDIFVTGAIINSSTGFIKLNGNTSSTLKGMFYSNKPFNDQWAYGIAAYQPQFLYAAIAGPGQVSSHNGTYRAGTPIPFVGVTNPLLTHLVNGGSGGGGNNYTGSTSSFENFTACITTASITTRSATTTSVTAKDIPVVVAKKSNLFSNQPPAAIVNDKETGNSNRATLYPNPATNRITITTQSGLLNEKGVLLNDVNGRSYPAKITRRISQNSLELDVSGLANGLYLITIKQAGVYTVFRFVKG